MWKKGLRKYSKITIRSPKEKSYEYSNYANVANRAIGRYLLFFWPVEYLPPLPLNTKLHFLLATEIGLVGN